MAPWGAFGFGLLIGWYVYYINRYRKGDVQFSDLVTLVGVIGGGTVTALFPVESTGTTKPDLFGAYGIGLAIGFFGYYAALLILVKRSANFDSDWFLDGRRRDVGAGFGIPGDTGPTVRAMDPVRHVEIAAFAAAAAVAATAGLRTGTAPPGASGDAPSAIPSAARPVIDACESSWGATNGDCNVFAKAVAGAFGITLTGQADDIADQIAGPGWTPVVDGASARLLAEDGMLVLAALKGGEQTPPVLHGHVAVVTAGPLAFGRYPTGYWGSLNGTPGRSKTLNWAWAKPDRDSVRYAARAV